MHFGTLSIFQNYRDEQSDIDIVQGELALARLAETTGFDSFWAVEHHFFPYSMCPDNFQFLAQVAGQTQRIKLGTGAVIVPWNDPYRIAAKTALLDNQSGGRALLGFGRGLSRREYAAMNVAMDEARGRFDQDWQQLAARRVCAQQVLRRWLHVGRPGERSRPGGRVHDARADEPEQDEPEQDQQARHEARVAPQVVQRRAESRGRPWRRR